MRNDVKESRDLILIAFVYLWGGFSLGKGGLEWVEFITISIGTLAALLLFIIHKYTQLNNTGGKK